MRSALEAHPAASPNAAGPAAATAAGPSPTAGKGRVIRFRYVTAALAGRWRESEAAAVEDAVRVGLAHRVEGELVWRVAARIDRDEGGWPAWPPRPEGK